MVYGHPTGLKRLQYRTVPRGENTMSKPKFEFQASFIAEMKDNLFKNGFFNRTKAEGVAYLAHEVKKNMLTNTDMLDVVTGIAATMIYAECVRKTRAAPKAKTDGSTVRTVVNKTRRQTLADQTLALTTQQVLLEFYEGKGVRPGFTPKDEGVTPKEIRAAIESAPALAHIPNIFEETESAQDAAAKAADAVEPEKEKVSEAA